MASSRHLIAGALARCTTATVMMPLDTIKTRLQFQGNLTSVRRYRSFVDAFCAILKEEGPAGFFRGLSAKLLYKAPAGAISFGCYELLKQVILNPSMIKTHYRDKSIDNPLIPLVAGTAARIIGTASRTPFDIIKQRMQVQGTLKKQTYASTIDASKQLWAKEGFRGLWTGFGVSLLRDMPFGTLYFVSYELLKQAQIRFLHSDVAINHLLAGAGSGFIATVFTIPFDVVKTRLQTQATLPPAERPYRNTADAFRRILREEGWRGLTTGLSARLMYLIPATSITFTAYEKYKLLLGVK